MTFLRLWSSRQWSSVGGDFMGQQELTARGGQKVAFWNFSV